MTRTLLGSQPETEAPGYHCVSFSQTYLCHLHRACPRRQGSGMSLKDPNSPHVSDVPLSTALRIIFYFEGGQMWSVKTFLLSLILSVICHEFFPLHFA